ncbi:MAG: SH3 domain-containing protein [Nitrospira sp.]|nr:SH3 domain-containing protein [Nitrospira sp.]
MSQGASAGDSKQSKRFQNPAYVYGPMVYQFPPEQGAEKESSKSNSGPNFLILLLLIVLVVGGVILYLKESGVDVGELGFRRVIQGHQIYRRASESQLQSSYIIQARVAVDSLYMREGPGSEYVATYLLPEDWEVALLGDLQTDNYGDVWVRVLVETEEGPQEGWVSRRYLGY